MAKIKFMFSCVTFYQFMLLRKDLGKRLVVTDGIIYPIVFQIIFYSVYEIFSLMFAGFGYFFYVDLSNGVCFRAAVSVAFRLVVIRKIPY